MSLENNAKAVKATAPRPESVYKIREPLKHEVWLDRLAFHKAPETGAGVRYSNRRRIRALKFFRFWRFFGKNYRERERLQKKLKQLRRKLTEVNIMERNFLLQGISNLYDVKHP